MASAAADLQQWLSWARLKPRDLTYRPKFHLLAHAAKQCRLFGPLKNVATERYESINAVQRQAAMHTNRSAPSKDIARRMEDRELVLHWASKGQLRREDEELQEDDTQATPRPLEGGSLLGDTLHSQSVKAIHKIWIKTDEAAREPGSFQEAGASAMYRALFDENDIGFDVKEEGENLPALDAELKVRQGKSLVTLAGEECAEGNFVSLRRPSLGTRREKYDYTVARIKSIWASSNQSVVLARVELFTLKKAGKYGCAELIGTGECRVLAAKDVVQLLNAQHHCLAHGCKIDSEAGSSRIERQTVRYSIPAIKHLGLRGSTPKYILNEYLHRFPPAELASLTANPTPIKMTTLDTIVSEAMKKMPSPPKKSRTGSNKRARLEDSDEDDDEFADADDDMYDADV
ncbi:hypothetical protein V8E36_001744 [Tilletia maclaganii]